MNFIRLSFIFLFVALLVLVSLYAAVQLGRNMTPWISWLGLLLAATTPLIFLALDRFQTKPIQPIAFSSICGLGVAIAMTSSWKHGNAAGMVHIWAGICLIGWFVYLKWYRTRFIKPH
jgi:hypothetical protein